MIEKLKGLFQKKPLEEEPPAVNEGDAGATSEEAESGEERVFARDERDRQAWVGIGLDGVLAERLGPEAGGAIGPLVPDMAARVVDWAKHKRMRVRVLTARVATADGAREVRAWLDGHGFDYLEATHAKDLHMVEFWDDRSVQVISNQGTPVGGSPHGLDQEPGADD